MVAHSSNFYNASVVPLLPPAAARTASAQSASFDVQNYDSVTLVANVGATGDTLNGTNRVEIQVQESDDNTTFTPVADADLARVVAGGQATGTFAILNAGGTVSQVYKTGYVGSKRYVRVALANFGTTASGTFIDVLAVGGRPRTSPAA